MNRFFDLIDKYKFGLIATVAAYMFIFSYLQVSSYTQHFPISPFQAGPEIIPEEEIFLDPDQIEVPLDYNASATNASRDRNDKRDRSDDNWSENKPMDGAAYAKAVEQSYKDETGGEAKRAEIRERYEAYKKEQEKLKKKNENNDNNDPSEGSGGNAPKGNVLVEWELSGRNSNRLPIPGYMCGKGAAGMIVMDITVNQSGNVVNAKFNSSQSTSSNYCMVEQARNYAMKSRFSYKSGSSQSGKIYYTFISQ